MIAPGQPESTGVDRPYLVRRNEVDRSGRDRHVLLDPVNRHGGVTREQRVHEALEVRREMPDDGMTTNAMPVSAGTWAKTVSNGSGPPADAPIPSTYRDGSPRIHLDHLYRPLPPAIPPPMSGMRCN